MASELDPGALFGELIELLARECAEPSSASLGSTLSPAGEHRDDAAALLAALLLDVANDLDAAQLYLGRARGHPLALWLRAHMALGAGGGADLPARLRAVESMASTQPAFRAEGRWVQIGEMWLLGLADGEQALRIGRAQLDANPNDLAAVDLVRRASALRQLAGATSGPGRGGHHGWSGWADGTVVASGPGSDNTFTLLEIEQQLELAAQSKELEETALEETDFAYRRRLALLDPQRHQEVRAATQLLRATRLEQAGRHDEALTVLRTVGEAGELSGAAYRCVVAETERRLVARGGDVGALTGVYERLWSWCPPPISRLWRLRAAALRESLGDIPLAETYYAALLDEEPADRVVVDAIERLGLRSGEVGAASMACRLAAAATQDAALQLRWLQRAALLAELRSGDLDGALDDIDAALSIAPSLSLAMEAIRVRRRAVHLGSRDALALLARDYRRASELTGDRRLRSALAELSGFVALVAGQLVEAESAFGRAMAERSEGDGWAALGLATLHRLRGNELERWRALHVAAPRMTNRFTRLALHLEAAALGATRLGEVAQAREHVALAAALDPNDPRVSYAFAQVADAEASWASAVDYRLQAVELSPQSLRRATWMVEVGTIREQHLGDPAGAEQAYQTAISFDPTSIEALRSLEQVFRTQSRVSDALGTLQRELQLTPDAQRRITLLVELAEYAESTMATGEMAIDSYLQALELDPGLLVALEGMERICRREARWDLLLETLERAPESPFRLRALAESYRAAERWPALLELCDHQRSTTLAAGDVVAAAEWTRELGLVYQRAMNDTEHAIVLYEEAIELHSTDQVAFALLKSALESLGRRREVVGVLERELLQAPPTDSAARGVLWAELGLLRWHEMGENGGAVTALEAAIESAPGYLPAVHALLELQAELGGEEALARLLEYYGTLDLSPAEQAKLFLHVGVGRERAGRLDQAQAAYAQSFALAPTFDEADPSVAPDEAGAFAALLRIARKQEHWRELLELYTQAVAAADAGMVADERRFDLYLQRAELQWVRLGHAGEAAASYLRAMELRPEDDRAVAALADIFAAEGDPRGLLNAYERRIELLQGGPKELETVRLAAELVANKLQDVDDALRWYIRLQALAPGDTEIEQRLTDLYIKNKSWGALIGLLSQQLARLEGMGAATPASLESRATLLMRLGHVAEEGLHDDKLAVEYYGKLVELMPNHRDAMEAQARIYESTERWTEFLDVTRRLVRVTTDRNVKAMLYFKCGSVFESRFNDDNQAIHYYDTAIKTSSACLPAVHGLRDLYLRRSDWPRVIQTLEIEVKLWQDNKERAGVLAQLGTVYADKLKDLDRATHYFQSALAIDPESWAANRALFEIYYERREYAEAAKSAALLGQRGLRDGAPAERGAFYTKRGVVARETGDPRAALEFFVTALDLYPEQWEALDGVVALARFAPRGSAAQSYDLEATLHDLEKRYERLALPEALAKVAVAQALVQEDLDAELATELYRKAVELAPTDQTILRAWVNFLIRLGRLGEAIEALEGRIEASPSAPGHVELRLQLAEIWDEGASDPERAAAVLESLLALVPTHREARYRLAQQLFVLGRFQEARGHAERLIELAAEPDQMAAPEELCRYYFYLGRTFDAQGDPQAAMSRYRRARELNPRYQPTIVALAVRAYDTGDRTGAVTLLKEAVEVIDLANGGAMPAGPTPRLRPAVAQPSGTLAAIPLRRRLAELYIKLGDTSGAITTYRAIVASYPSPTSPSILTLTDSDGVNPSPIPTKVEERLASQADDRVRLAALLVDTTDGMAEGMALLTEMVDRGVRHEDAFRLLADLFRRHGAGERAHRLLSALDVYSFASDTDRSELAQLRSGHRRVRHRTVLQDSGRDCLWPLTAQGPLAELYAATNELWSELYAPRALPENIRHYNEWPSRDLRNLVDDALTLFSVRCTVAAADRVPGGLLLIDLPQPMILLDASLLPGMGEPAAPPPLPNASMDGLRSGRPGPPPIPTEDDSSPALLDRARPNLSYVPRLQEAELRFVLGWTLELVRSRYGLITRLGPREIDTLCAMLLALAQPATSRSPSVQALYERIGKPAARMAVDRVANEVASGVALGLTDVQRWLGAVETAGSRAGLVYCDDVGVALRMTGRLQADALRLIPARMQPRAGANVGPDGRPLNGGGQSDGRGLSLPGPGGESTGETRPFQSGPSGPTWPSLFTTVLPSAVAGGSDLVRFYLSDDYHRIRAGLLDPGPGYGLGLATPATEGGRSAGQAAQTRGFAR